jgi:hypothetical protein
MSIKPEDFINALADLENLVHAHFILNDAGRIEFARVVGLVHVAHNREVNHWKVAHADEVRKKRAGQDHDYEAHHSPEAKKP